MIPLLLVVAAVVAVVGACTRPTSTRVVTVRTVVEQGPLCQLPPLPMPATVVGFPVEAPRDLTLAVTKADAEELRRELDGLRAWAIAVTTCLERRARTTTESRNNAAACLQRGRRPLVLAPLATVTVLCAVFMRVPTRRTADDNVARQPRSV